MFDITKLAGCFISTVYKILRLYRLHDQLNNSYACQHEGQPCALTTPDFTYLISLIQNNPTLYLNEMQEQLSQNRAVDVSITTLSRSLCRLAYSHKQLTWEAWEWDKLLHATWQAAHAHIPKEYFLWLNKSSIDVMEARLDVCTEVKQNLKGSNETRRWVTRPTDALNSEDSNRCRAKSNDQVNILNTKEYMRGLI